MAAAASTVVAFIRQAVRTLSRWETTAARAEAVLIGRSAPDAVQVERLEALAFALAQTRAAFLRLDGLALDGRRLEALRQAWRSAAALLSKRGDSFVASQEQVQALEVVRHVLESAAVQVTPATDIYESGSLSIGGLEGELRSLIAEVDWQEVERAVGAPIPESVRQRPLEIETQDDHFDGQATLAVRYAPWASEPVRNGVQRLLQDDWLPTIRSQQGQGAIGEPQSDRDSPEAHVCRVLFGTNRERSGGGFSNACAEGDEALTLGQALVSVPNRRKRGSVPRPWSVLGVGSALDAAKHILLTAPPTVLSHAQFVAAIKASAGPGSALLFVHGFNTHFEGGLWRTAQLATDLDVEGPVFHYAWPSAGNPLRYDYDAENVKASRTPFKAFVQTILAEGGVTGLSVIAHSKGNELVLDAFNDLAIEAGGQRRAQHLVLASPDVDRAVAKDRLIQTPSFFESVTLYANAFDRPLLLSAGKSSRARIGGMMSDRYPFIMAGVDTIDAANTDFGWFGMNHDAYVDAPILMYDIAALLRKGVRPPNERSPVIQPRDCKRGRYYRVVTE